MLKTLKPTIMKSFILFSLFGTAILFSSCGSTKNIVYFDNIQDEKLKSELPSADPMIQINDILSIVVSAWDKESVIPFNAPNESSMNTAMGSNSVNRITIGYLVNAKGEINFPVLGTIQAAGQTRNQLTEYLTRQLADKQLLVHPIVTIRHLNYRVSVLGEVARPGVFNVPNEKLSLLEALSFAGDITIYGRRNNVLLIRENDKGEKTIKRLDLTSRDILTSPYYYLQSNDILYVEPAQNRLAREKSNQTLPIVLSALSLVIIGITSFK